jgi:hypothetical protein
MVLIIHGLTLYGLGLTYCSAAILPLSHLCFSLYTKITQYIQYIYLQQAYLSVPSFHGVIVSVAL